MARRVNRARARRLARAAVERIQGPPPPLPEAHRTLLANYSPAKPPEELRERVRAAAVAVMERADHITNRTVFQRLLTDVAGLATWAARTDRDLAWTALMDHKVIAAYAASSNPPMTAAGMNRRGTRLQQLASRINPGDDSPDRIPTGARQPIKPPYSDAEMAAIVRTARGQANRNAGRQLSLIVALTRGAGATSADLLDLELGHIEDLGPDGIRVTLGRGDRVRAVPMRRQYEDLLLDNLPDGPPGHPVLGRRSRNAVNALIGSATILSSDVPPIEAARLRTTWLAELMGLPLPLATIMAAAGLTSARTISDLASWTPADPDAYRTVLRGDRA